MEKPAPTKRARQKRNRVITACTNCRASKAGCDRTKPICSRCKVKSEDCVYLDPPHNALVNGVSKDLSSLPGHIKEAVRHLYQQCSGDNKEEDASDLENLESTPFVAESASFEDDVDETPTSDFGFRIGKVYMTDRLGGQFRPVIAHELRMLLQTSSFQREWAEEQLKWPTPLEIYDMDILSSDQSFLQPSPNYLAPSLNVLSIGPDVNIMKFLPPRDVSLRILENYWISVHPLVRVLHRPTFEKKWATFAEQVSSAIRPTKSLQALVFSVLFSGIVAMPTTTLSVELRQDHSFWLQNLKTGTELALTQAQIFQTTKIETIQAFVAYLLVLCREEVGKLHSTLVAAAIRVAEFNGIHVDGEERGYHAVETHIRRLVWHNLCILDIRTAEAQGPWPIIDPANYTTKLPDNLNDADVAPGSPSTTTVNRWTEMTLPLIRYRCADFTRNLWTLRRKLIKKEVSIASALTTIENFRSEWSLNYAPSDPEDPIQRYGMCVFDILTSRAYAALLQNYHLHSKLKMPDRLLSILIQHGIKNMDRVIELETSSEYQRFRWYAGAIQQHHFALLMVAEICLNPRRKDAARIWRGLNYVFEPPNLPPVARARWILMQSWGRMQIYLSKRSLRAPKNLEEKMRQALKLSDAGMQRSGRELSITTDDSAGLLSPQAAENLRSPGLENHRLGSPSSNYSAQSPVSIADDNGLLTVPGGFAAPEKQVVNVDWNMLDSYFPPEKFTSDLDLDFETWSAMLHNAPASANVFDHLDPYSTQQSYYDPLSLPDPSPAASRRWTSPSSQYTSPPPMTEPSSYLQSGIPEERKENVRRHANQANFGMGLYSLSRNV